MHDELLVLHSKDRDVARQMRRQRDLGPVGGGVKGVHEERFAAQHGPLQRLQQATGRLRFDADVAIHAHHCPGLDTKLVALVHEHFGESVRRLVQQLGLDHACALLN